MAKDVLVLEPDALQRDLIVLALKRGGYMPLVVEQAADLPGILLTRKPDLLILDIYQGEKNGLDMLEDLRHAGLSVLTRVIVVSSMSFPEVVSKARRLGAVDFLVKPLNSDLLLERVGKLMAER